jgi:hypothetical protein
MHVHVQTGDGEAKFWLEPEIELAQSHGLAQQEVHTIEGLIQQRKNELIDAWRTHFGS